MISVVISTVSRRDTAMRLLTCLSTQTTMPDQVVVVEQGDVVWSEEDVPPSLRKCVEFIYSSDRSLAKSRETGRAASKNEIIAFFDDDILIEPNYIEVAKQYLEKHPEICGIGGAYEDKFTKNRSNITILIGVVMGIYSSGRTNKILGSGWGDYVRGPATQVISDAEWLFGCNTVFRSSVLVAEKSLLPTEMLTWSFLEDLFLGMRLSRGLGLKMRLLPDLKVIHAPAQTFGTITPASIRMRVLYRYILWRELQGSTGNANAKFRFWWGMAANTILLVRQEPRGWVFWECIKSHLFVLRTKEIDFGKANEFISAKN